MQTWKTQFKFNPAKTEGGITNADRARRGHASVKNAADFGQNDVETDIADCVADIFHYCDMEEIDVEEVLRHARMHWEEER